MAMTYGVMAYRVKKVISGGGASNVGVAYSTSRQTSIPNDKCQRSNWTKYQAIGRSKPMTWRMK